jgi:CheY-like chemotaxis protein
MARIMVVEDEPITAADLEQKLGALGHEVTWVDTGEEAIAEARAIEHDVILMDIRLRSDMSGIDAAQQLRQRSDVPIVFLTAFADPQTVERACATLPHGYLLKPFTERSVATAVQVALTRARAERAQREGARWTELAAHRRIVGMKRSTPRSPRPSRLDPVHITVHLGSIHVGPLSLAPMRPRSFRNFRGNFWAPRRVGAAHSFYAHFKRSTPCRSSRPSWLLLPSACTSAGPFGGTNKYLVGDVSRSCRRIPSISIASRVPGDQCPETLITARRAEAHLVPHPSNAVGRGHQLSSSAITYVRLCRSGLNT